MEGDELAEALHGVQTAAAEHSLGQPVDVTAGLAGGVWWECR